MSMIDYAGLAALLTAAVALWKAYRTTPADLASRYQEIATRAATRIDELEKCMDNVEAENQTLEARVENLEKQMQRYLAGIRLLINQLQANGLQPVWAPDEDSNDPTPHR